MDESLTKSQNTNRIITRRRFLRLPDGWTSFEAAKLSVELLKGLAFPAALAYVGLQVSRTQQAEDALMRRRIQGLDVIAPAANDILCFVTVVGRWRDLTPEDVLDRKRQIDAEMWTYLGVWSNNAWLGYQAFMKMVFDEYGGGSASDATIYGDVNFLQREMGKHFMPEWKAKFAAPPSWWKRDAVKKSYEDWMRVAIGG